MGDQLIVEGVQMLKAMIVDDEAPARSELTYLLGEVEPGEDGVRFA